ncbi:MAG: hypothetical protein WD716_13410 [Fimbriimonadaceae bacterium]
MSEVKKRGLVRLLPQTAQDWIGSSGKTFKSLFLSIVAIGKKHIDAEELAAAGKAAVIDSALRQGHENTCKQAEALKYFEETEKTRLESELLRRSMKARVKSEEADAAAKDADAKVKQVDAIKKYVELQEWLNSKGLAVAEDEDGNFLVMPSKLVDYSELPSPQDLLAEKADFE